MIEPHFLPSFLPSAHIENTPFYPRIGIHPAKIRLWPKRVGKNRAANRPPFENLIRPLDSALNFERTRRRGRVETKDNIFARYCWRIINTVSGGGFQILVCGINYTRCINQLSPHFESKLTRPPFEEQWIRSTE